MVAERMVSILPLICIKLIYFRFVLATRSEAVNNRAPVFLRAYRHPHNPREDAFSDITIWQAARATSAAPPYFHPVEVRQRKLIDGAFGANNPLGW
jgi:patatin-like phospholipase/acyl hydrolase